MSEPDLADHRPPGAGASRGPAASAAKPPNPGQPRARLRLRQWLRQWLAASREPRGAWPRTRREWAADAVIAAVVIAAEVGGSHAAGSWKTGPSLQPSPHPGVLAYLLLASGGAALLARRRYPTAVLAFALVTTLWAEALSARLVWLALIIAFLTAVVARRREAAIASLLIGYLASVWPPWLIGQAGHTAVSFALELAASLVFLLIIGELIRVRSQRSAALRHSREEERRRRASEERMRMARDLHDVVAHNISVINVQANTALHLMDRQPDRARSALVTINEISKQALVELRSVLGVLRDVDGAAPLAPTPGLSRLGELVDTAAAAGLTVRVTQDGPQATLPVEVDLAAYRIVQEALTNSARHSGGKNAAVRLGYGDHGLLIEVADDGGPRPDRPAARSEGSGSGIAGMAERAAALGGTLHAGPRPDGGFRVRAWLPLSREPGASGVRR
jgi:signal transduction histidine kinase